MVIVFAIPHIVSAADYPSQIVSVASGEIGKSDSGTGYKYSSYSGVRGQAWCAAFISWCAGQAGIPTTAIPNTGSCATMYSMILNGGGTVTSTPQKGDLVFYKSSSGRWSHVGLMVDSTNSIQGNVTSGGRNPQVRQFKASAMNFYPVRVYVRPNYGNISSPSLPSSGTSNEPTTVETPSTPSVSVNGQNVTVSWNSVNRASSYDVYLVQSPWSWESIKYNQHLTGTSHTFSNVAAGQYRAFVIARPNPDTAQSPWTEVNVTVTVAPTKISLPVKGASNISNSTARVDASCEYTGKHPSSVGLYIGTSTDNMYYWGSDVINHNKDPFDIWYNLNSLQENSTYYYKFYAIMPDTGEVVWSDVNSFTTSTNGVNGVVVNTGGQYLAINDAPAASPTRSNQIGRIPPGGYVIVDTARTYGNWYWVTYGGVSGYAYNKYISLM